MSVKVTYIDRGFRKMMSNLKEIETQEPAVKVGFPEDPNPRKMVRHDGELKSNAEVAIANEYGTRNAPPRPFLRPAIENNKKKMLKHFAAFFSTALHAPKWDTAALGDLGAFFVTKIKNKIKSNVPPENRPSTVAKKGHGRTLRDSYQMLRAVAFKVVNLK